MRILGIRNVCLLVLVLVLLLGGCATGGGAFSKLTSFMNTFEAAQKDYEQGRIMEARERILSIDKSRSDYAPAQRLLRTKVEPARLRLLRHYQRKGEQAEKNKIWYQAQRLYAQAAEFSTTPEVFLKKSKAMEMNMRQERMDLLLKARRKEDDELMSWPRAYEASRGVAPNDETLVRTRENYQDAMDDRIQLSYWEAKRYLRKDLPELAYVQAESHLRLSPDSVGGKRLMEEVKAEMPPEIKIPPEHDHVRRKAPVTSRQGRSEAVTAAKIEELIQAGEWQKARQFALIYRREGGKGADQLLKQVDAGIENEAKALFERGRVEFRREKLDKAVEYWEKAAELMPDNAEYVDALRRAQQMQERLRLLRGADTPDSGK